MKPPLLAVRLLAVAALLLAGCSKRPPPAAPPPVQVGTLSVHPQSVPLDKQLVGRVSAYYSANVTARVSGVLLDRRYREGSEVHRGQLLFQIDPAFYKAQLDSDLALLAEDRATSINDRITAGRYHKLLPVGSVSQQSVDNADAAARSAAAKVQADEASVESARVNLGYTRVSAPIDGIAGQQQVTVGAVVGSGTSDSGASGTLLTTVEQIDPVYVNFAISAADLTTLREAQAAGHVALAGQSATKVKIGLPNGAGYSRDGVLDFSDVLVNATTGAVDLRARVPNPAHTLLPGMYVTLKVNFGTQDNVFLVPQQAMQRDTVGAYLMVVGANGKAVRKDVEANVNYGTDWIVTKGLADNDKVIVTNLQNVREGAPVSAQPWQAPAQPAPGATAAQ
jgi:membrane fusion protein (multidrug efflux system)